MESMGKKPRRRRSFTPEFQAEIVDLCQRGDRSSGQVARDFDLTETAVREWVKQAERDTGTRSDGGLTSTGRQELADYRNRVEALTVAEAVLPGVQQSPLLFLPSTANEHLFHLMFNRLPTMNEQLVQGREDIYSASSSTLRPGSSSCPATPLGPTSTTWPPSPERCAAASGFTARGMSPCAERPVCAQKLTIPVLAVGGAESLGKGEPGTR